MLHAVLTLQDPRPIAEPFPTALTIVLALLLGLLVWHSAAALRKLSRFASTAASSGGLRRCALPLLLAVLAFAALRLLWRLPHHTPYGPPLELALRVIWLLSLTWLAANLLAVLVEAFVARHDVSTADNLRARQVHTQYRILVRLGRILVWTLGVAVVLSTFPAVRALGTGLLASAGIAGLVIGLAAQRTIGNFLAGLQIALTQPIRLDDAVVIDGEWGWIEDVTTTYVVVKIWDERRLIVPFSRLLEEPFQNWTRTRADLLGSVTLWTDYRAPVEALRAELHRIVEGNDLWDGRVAVLQVVDSSERAIQLRALVSASSSPRAWDLRCHVREKLVSFLAREYPEALPLLRAEVESEAAQRETTSPAHSEPETGGLPGEPES